MVNDITSPEYTSELLKHLTPVWFHTSTELPLSPMKSNEILIFTAVIGTLQGPIPSDDEDGASETVGEIDGAGEEDGIAGTNRSKAFTVAVEVRDPNMAIFPSPEIATLVKFPSMDSMSQSLPDSLNAAINALVLQAMTTTFPSFNKSNEEPRHPRLRRNTTSNTESETTTTATITRCDYK